MTISLQIIVDNATDATMTMPVAAEKPPRNASIVSQSWLADIGRPSTNISPVKVPDGNRLKPASVIGTTKMENMTRYSGNAQRAA